MFVSVRVCSNFGGYISFSRYLYFFWGFLMFMIGYLFIDFIIFVVVGIKFKGIRYK